MIIRAKLKGDKEPREISFTGHGQNDPDKVKELFENANPGGEFIEIVEPGLNGATGHTFIPDNGNEGLPAPVATAPAIDGTPAREGAPAPSSAPVGESRPNRRGDSL